MRLMMHEATVEEIHAEIDDDSEALP